MLYYNKKGELIMSHTTQLTLQLLEGTYGVCRLAPTEPLPPWGSLDPFYSVTRTQDELSIVCLESSIPKDIVTESPWRILKVVGPLDFSLVGILSKLSTLMANAHISIFAISTYDTDYLLIKESNIEKAIHVLQDEGYGVIN